MPVHGECIASRGLRAELGVPSTEPSTVWSAEADVPVFWQRRPTCGGSRPPSSSVKLLHRYAYKPSSIIGGGYQADCYKLLSSCILTSVLDKGEPAAR